MKTNHPNEFKGRSKFAEQSFQVKIPMLQFLSSRHAVNMECLTKQFDLWIHLAVSVKFSKKKKKKKKIGLQK